MNAEISLLAANGPMRGKQHTYVALPPATVTMTHDELLAEGARRYARGHGPFRDKDLAWWTSLTLTDSRRAIQLAELRPLDVDGQAYWTLDEPVDAEVPRAMLLSNFDEYISYARDPEDYEGFDGTVDDVMRGGGLLMIDGRLCGRWTRTITAKKVTIVGRTRTTTHRPDPPRARRRGCGVRPVRGPRSRARDRRMTARRPAARDVRHVPAGRRQRCGDSSANLPAGGWSVALPC